MNPTSSLFLFMVLAVMIFGAVKCSQRARQNAAQPPASSSP